MIKIWYNSIMFISKAIFNFKNLILILILSTFGVLFFFTNERSFTASDYIETNQVGFVYDGDNLVSTSSNQKEIDDSKKIYNNYLDEDTSGKLNTTYNTSESLVSFAKAPETQNDYLSNNSEYLTSGYTITIDDNSFYIKDKAYLKYVKDLLVNTYVPSTQAISIYNSTGQLPTFDYNGKKYTDVEIDNNVNIEESYVSTDKIIDTKEKFLFYIMHGDVKPIYVEMKPGENIEQIQAENGIDAKTFEIDNPGLNNNTLLYSGQKFLVNKLTPLIDVTYYYQFVEQEPIYYGQETIYDDSLQEGVSKITQEGKNGIQDVTYRSKVTNGELQSTNAVDSLVITRPVNEQTTVGTKVVPGVGTGQFGWPGSTRNVICGYGCYAGHFGTDIQSWYGAPIYAADNGVVIEAGYSSSQGNHIIIDHGNGFITKYYHMSSTAATLGQSVAQGQVIGYEGETGIVTTEHLHYEIVDHGVRYDAMNYY